MDNKTKVKVIKGDPLWFDPDTGWTGTRAWMCKTYLIQLSDKSLQTLIDAGVKFFQNRTKQGGLETGPDVEPPNFQRLLNQYVKEGTQRVKAEKTNLVWATRIKGPDYILVNTLGLEQPAYIDRQLEGLLELGEIETLPEKHNPLIITDKTEIIAVVMPCQVTESLPTFGTLEEQP